LYPSRDRKNDSRKLEVEVSFERARFVYSDNMSEAPAQASANDPTDFKNEENVKRFVRPNRWLSLDIAGIPVRFETRARYNTSWFAREDSVTTTRDFSSATVTSSQLCRREEMKFRSLHWKSDYEAAEQLSKGH
jgi:hypothetical protein